LNDLDLGENFRRKLCGVADDDAHRFVGLEQKPDDFRADVPGGRGDDDHLVFVGVAE